MHGHTKNTILELPNGNKNLIEHLIKDTSSLEKSLVIKFLLDKINHKSQFLINGNSFLKDDDFDTDLKKTIIEDYKNNLRFVFNLIKKQNLDLDNFSSFFNNKIRDFFKLDIQTNAVFIYKEMQNIFKNDNFNNLSTEDKLDKIKNNIFLKVALNSKNDDLKNIYEDLLSKIKNQIDYKTILFDLYKDFKIGQYNDLIKNSENLTLNKVEIECIKNLTKLNYPNINKDDKWQEFYTLIKKDKSYFLVENTNFKDKNSPKININDFRHDTKEQAENCAKEYYKTRQLGIAINIKNSYKIKSSNASDEKVLDFILEGLKDNSEGIKFEITKINDNNVVFNSSDKISYVLNQELIDNGKLNDFIKNTINHAIEKRMEFNNIKKEIKPTTYDNQIQQVLDFMV